MGEQEWHNAVVVSAHTRLRYLVTDIGKAILNDSGLLMSKVKHEDVHIGHLLKVRLRQTPDHLPWFETSPYTVVQLEKVDSLPGMEVVERTRNNVMLRITVSFLRRCTNTLGFSYSVYWNDDIGELFDEKNIVEPSPEKQYEVHAMVGRDPRNSREGAVVILRLLKTVSPRGRMSTTPSNHSQSNRSGSDYSEWLIGFIGNPSFVSFRQFETDAVIFRDKEKLKLFAEEHHGEWARCRVREGRRGPVVEEMEQIEKEEQPTETRVHRRVPEVKIVCHYDGYTTEDDGSPVLENELVGYIVDVDRILRLPPGQHRIYELWAVRHHRDDHRCRWKISLYSENVDLTPRRASPRVTPKYEDVEENIVDGVDNLAIEADAQAEVSSIVQPTREQMFESLLRRLLSNSSIAQTIREKDKELYELVRDKLIDG